MRVYILLLCLGALLWAADCNAQMGRRGGGGGGARASMANRSTGARSANVQNRASTANVQNRANTANVQNRSNTNIQNRTENVNVNRNVNRNVDRDVDFEGGGCWNCGYDNDWNWGAFAAGAVTAGVVHNATYPHYGYAAPVYAAPVVGTVVTTLPGGCTTIAGDVTMYNCASVYYRPYYQGTTLVYEVVNH